MIEKKRLPAKKVRIQDLIYGKYFPGDKEMMKASYLITPFGEKVSRVTLVGTVTEKFTREDGMFSSITVDDSTGNIQARVFGEDSKKIEKIETGNLVNVIGKIKQYNEESYVNLEIVRKIDHDVENHRKLEILKNLMEKKKIVDEIRQLIDQTSEEELKELVKEKFGIDEEILQVIRDNLRVHKQIDYKPKMLEVIRTLDDGNGVEIGKILEISDLPENIIESAINELLANGSLFEPSPGRLRIV